MPSALNGSPNQPCDDIVSTPSGHGYWVLCLDGGVFSFGDAQFEGSVPGAGVQIPLPTVTSLTPTTTKALLPLTETTSMARTPNGKGYWVASLDGGVFAFGNAPFKGSVPGVNSSIFSVTSPVSRP